MRWLSELYGRTFTFGDLLTLIAMVGAVASAIVSAIKSFNARKSEKQAKEYAKNSDEHNRAATEYYKVQLEEFNLRKQDIGNSNALVLEEIDELREWVKAFRGESTLILDGGNASSQNELTDDQLKEKAYKYICVKTEATASEIADHLQISEARAKELLTELCRYDNLITHSIIHDSEDDECVWFPKRR